MDSYLNMERPSNSFWVRGEGWCSSARHNNVIKKAIEGGASHILILGADQVHPLDMIPRLITKVEDGFDVVSAQVPMRGKVEGSPWYSMSTGFVRNADGFDLVEDAPSFYKVDCIGSGVLIFPVYALDKLKKPYFKEIVEDEAEYIRKPNQDVVFTQRLTNAGFEIWVDASIKVTHGGWMAVDETFKERFNDYNEDR